MAQRLLTALTHTTPQELSATTAIWWLMERYRATELRNEKL